MTIENFQKICLKLPGVTQDIKWEDHLCFNVGGKMFLVSSPDSVPVSASFKVSTEDFDIICERQGFIPAPYMARHKWVHLDDISRLNQREWEERIATSYSLVFSKLPAKMRKELEK